MQMRSHFSLTETPLNLEFLGIIGVMAVPILKEPPITTREAIIPYLMSGVNMLAPILVARDILWPQVFVTAIAMIIVGLPVSIYFRQRQYNRIVMNLLIMLPLLVFTWALVHAHPGLQIDWGNLWSSVLARDSMDMLGGLLHIFALLAAGRAFLLVTSTDLLQTPLPSFSIYLLAVITDRELERNPFALACLLMLFASSLYLFSQEQSQQWFSIHTPLRFQRRLILWTLLFSLVLLPVIISLGWTLQPLNMVALATRSHNRRSWQFHLPFLTPPQFALSFNDNIDMMGGDWPRGKQQMMMVTVVGKAQNLLWRAGTYSYYNQETAQWQAKGSHHARSGWTVPLNGTALTVTTDPLGECSDPGLVEAIRENIIHPNNKDEQITQHITLQADVGGDVEPLYGVFQIYQVQATSSTLFRVIGNEDSSLTFRAPDNTLKVYDVVSINKPLPTIMKRLRVNPPLPYRWDYLQMPGGNSHIPGEKDGAYMQQVRNKALAILAEDGLNQNSNAFEIVHRLELYLGKHYRYTLKPAPPKPGADPILNFIFNSPQGYCNYFSGAMVMLCRSINIPARFAVGFATGEVVEEKSNAGITAYQVTSDDAHSWVEVYLPNYGWYTMDPTAGSKPVPTVWGETWDSIANFFATVKSAITTFITTVRSNRRLQGYTYLALAAILVLLAGVIYWHRERPPAMPRRPLTDEQARTTVIACYRRLHRWLHRWGVEKPQGLTALEFDQLFRTLNPPMGALVGELTALYLRAYYSTATLHDADARHTIELLQQLWDLAGTERKHLHAQETGV